MIARLFAFLCKFVLGYFQFQKAVFGIQASGSQINQTKHCHVCKFKYKYIVNMMNHATVRHTVLR